MQAEPAKGAKQSRKGPAGTASGSSAAGRGPAAAGAGRKRKAEVPNGSQGRDTTAKQQRRAVPQRPSTARSSKFEELLGDLNVREARIGAQMWPELCRSYFWLRLMCPVSVSNDPNVAKWDISSTGWQARTVKLCEQTEE